MRIVPAAPRSHIGPTEIAVASTGRAIRGPFEALVSRQAHVGGRSSADSRSKDRASRAVAENRYGAVGEAWACARHRNGVDQSPPLLQAIEPARRRRRRPPWCLCRRCIGQVDLPSFRPQHRLDRSRSTRSRRDLAFPNHNGEAVLQRQHGPAFMRSTIEPTVEGHEVLHSPFTGSSRGRTGERIAPVESLRAYFHTGLSPS